MKNVFMIILCTFILISCSSTKEDLQTINTTEPPSTAESISKDIALETPPTDIPTKVLATATVTVMSIGGNWSSGTDMPTPRWDFYTCVINGKIYLIGGAQGYKALGTVEVYDPATDTWETKSPMPSARQGFSASVVNGKIYAIGGAEFIGGFWKSDKFSTVEEYNPSTDTWTTKSPMPTVRGWHSANVVDGKIYIIAGAQGGNNPTGVQNRTVLIYNPTTDTWSQKNDMPVPRGAGSGGVMDGKIYFFGGYGGKERVDEYDPSTDTWTQKSDMPIGRVALSTTVLDGKIYLIGGHGPTYDLGITKVDVYDPATDTWATAPEMPTGRFGGYSGLVDGKIYVFGGLPDYPGEALDIVEIYEP